MNKSHTYSVSLLLIVFTVMILCSLFGDQIYKLTTPNVKAEVVKVAVWDNVKYNCVIEKDNIYEVLPFMAILCLLFTVTSLNFWSSDAASYSENC